MADIVTTLVVPPPIQTTLAIGQGPAGPQGVKGDKGDKGDQGDPGQDGALGSDLHYTHEQMAPSAFWTINHGLNKKPVVQAFDSDGNEIEGIVRHVNLNTSTIEYAVAIGGTAECN